MKKGLLTFICMLLLLPIMGVSALEQDESDPYGWEYRKTITVTENAGIPRLSHPVSIRMSMDGMNTDASDIRVTDSEGNLLPYQIIDKNVADKLIVIRIGVNLPAYGTAKYYVYYGNPDANPPLQTNAGVEKHIGKSFITKAWGKVVISSYSKDNTITIENEEGNFPYDAEKGHMVSPEVYQPGSVRIFSLKESTTLKITGTGECTVAVGNFDYNGDSTAFIPNTSYCYILVPEYLAVTSIHNENTVRVFSRGKPVANEVLSAGDTLYLSDKVNQSYCQVETDKNCVVQYGSNVDQSVFAVPQKGLKYTYMPIGLVCISSAFDGTKVDITWSDENKLPETLTLNAGQKKMFVNPALMGGTLRKATTITSSRPITVLAMGKDSHGHGATYLPSITGFFLGDEWNTITGTADKSTEQRDIWLIQPFSQGTVRESGDLFEEISGEAVRSSGAKVNGSQASVRCSVSEAMMILDGNPADKSILFQVPTALEQGVHRTISGEAETTEGGWLVEGARPVIPGTQEPEPDVTEPAQDDEKGSSISAFIKRIFTSVGNPGADPIAFTIFLVLVTALLLLCAGLFFKFSPASGDDEFLDTSYEETQLKKAKRSPSPEQIEQMTKQQAPITDTAISLPKRERKLESRSEPYATQRPEPEPSLELESKVELEHKPEQEQPPQPEPEPTPPPKPKPEKEPELKKPQKPQTTVGQFKAPRLRKPNLSRFMINDTTSVRPPEPKPEPAPEPSQLSASEPTRPEPKPTSQPEQIKPEPEPKPTPESESIAKPSISPEPTPERSNLFEQKAVEAQEPEPPRPQPKPIESKKPTPPTQSDDTVINAVAELDEPTHQPSTHQIELAERMNAGGLVADAGALVRLQHEGLIHIFDQIHISHTASMLLPEELLECGVLVKVTIMGKDAKRANRLSDEYGIFPEASRALVVAEKTNVKYYLTSAKLPRRIGKLNIIHVERIS